MSKSVLVEVSFKRTKEGFIEQGKGQEKTTYPNLGTFLQESLMDEVKTAVWIGAKADEELVLTIEKVRR